MRSLVLSLVLTATAFSVPALAQDSTAPDAAVACPPTATLEDLIKAIDSGVSGYADKDRTCMRDLMMPQATLSPLAKAADGSYAPHILTIDGWVEAVKKRGHIMLYERQVKVSTDMYGHIAHLWSTYELRFTPDGKADVRGINSIEAVNDGKRWRILNIQWQAETPDEPVPTKYLP